jgi:hypothetical protein
LIFANAVCLQYEEIAEEEEEDDAETDREVVGGFVNGRRKNLMEANMLGPQSRSWEDDDDEENPEVEAAVLVRAPSKAVSGLLIAWNVHCCFGL